MLKVDRKYVDALREAVVTLCVQKDEASAKETLRENLHEAMRLEATTIPPYYVAAWSIQNSEGYQNELIRDLISEVSREEMLHMMSVANIIAATGVSPKIATKEIVVDWGNDTLPIGSDLIPSLSLFSMKLLTNLFMEIEKPEDPVHYVVVEQREKAMLMMEEHYATIGEFYDALIELINSFPNDPFADGANYPQINISDDPRFTNIDHAPITDFVVKNREKAIELLNWIVDQGEGSSDGPMDGNGAPAHYYRFAEIYMGGKLVKDTSQPLGYAYDRGNHPINCDFSKIYQFESNPKMADFPKDSRQYKGLLAFNKSYKLMFDELQKFYNGDGDQHINTSISSMNKMARYVIPLLTSNPPVCPSFEWIEEESSDMLANNTSSNVIGHRI